jgi:hypothetical protein
LNNGGELKEGFSSLKAQRSNPGELLLYNFTKLKEQFREINKKFFFNNHSTTPPTLTATADRYSTTFHFLKKGFSQEVSKGSIKRIVLPVDRVR